MIPGLTDHRDAGLFSPLRARAAGAQHAGYTLAAAAAWVAGIVYQPGSNNIFLEKKDKVLSRVRAVRGGSLNDPRFGARMKGEGVIADTVKQIFTVTRQKLGFVKWPGLSVAAFRRPDETPRLLFSGDGE